MKKLLLLTLMLSCIQTVVFGQSIEPLSNLPQISSYFGNSISANNSIYGQFHGTRHYELVKYDGTNYSIIPNPPNYITDTMHPFAGYTGHPIQKDSFLYLAYSTSNSNNLFKYNLNTGQFTQITSNSPGQPYEGKAYFLDSLLFFTQSGLDYNFDLYKYDGSTVVEIPCPPNYSTPYRGHTGMPIGLAGNLFVTLDGNTVGADLFKYNTTTGSFQALPRPVDYTVNNTVASKKVVGDNLYLRYANNSNSHLFRYNNTLDSLFKISNPTGFHYSENMEQDIIFDGSNLYLMYQSDTIYNYTLYKFNIQTEVLTAVPNPVGYRGVGSGYSGSSASTSTTSFLIGTDLFLRYRQDNGSYKLFKYNTLSGVLSEILSPAGYSGNNRGYSDGIVVAGQLYLRYRDNNGDYNLFKYNNGNLQLIPSPPGAYNWGHYYNDFSVLNNSLYLMAGLKMGRVSNKSFSVINPAVCDNSAYTFADSTWSSAGVYPYPAGTNAAGFDSTVYVNLSYPIIDTSVTVAGLVLSSNTYNATYQWVDCNNGNAAIAGATDRTYTATNNGSYAVIINLDGCIETSACQQIGPVAVHVIDGSLNMRAYPNPTNGQLTLDFGKELEQANVGVYNLLGQVVFSGIYNNSQQINLNLDVVAGTYFVRVSSSQGLEATIKIIKQ